MDDKFKMLLVKKNVIQEPIKEKTLEQKVKLAIIAANLGINGISTVVMNYCRHINTDRFAITIMAGVPVASSYKKECDQIGIRVIELPSKKQMPKQYYKVLWENLSGSYDIVHIHGNSRVLTVELFLACMKRIHIRIPHCHNTSCDHMRLHKFLRPVFNLLYTNGFACSIAAGKWLFGERKFLVIPNGFDTSKYFFQENVRAEMRKRLSVENKYLIGHVGGFNKAKNHDFILEVFEKVAEQNMDAYLILVGNGSEFQKINCQIEKHPFRDRIIIYGETEEPEKIYAAMDAFLFPSKHEGLGIALLEAQISGLPCVVSDVVPQEVELGGQVTFLSLNDDISLWCNALVCPKTYNREKFYEENIEAINRYDIYENVHYLEKLYLSFLKDKHNRL